MIRSAAPTGKQASLYANVKQQELLLRVSDPYVTGTHICGFQLKGLLFRVDYRMFLNIRACSCYPNDLQEKGNTTQAWYRENHFNITNKEYINIHIKASLQHDLTYRLGHGGQTPLCAEQSGAV